MKMFLILSVMLQVYNIFLILLKLPLKFLFLCKSVWNKSCLHAMFSQSFHSHSPRGLVHAISFLKIIPSALSLRRRLLRREFPGVTHKLLGESLPPQRPTPCEAVRVHHPNTLLISLHHAPLFLTCSIFSFLLYHSHQQTNMLSICSS